MTGFAFDFGRIDGPGLAPVVEPVPVIDGQGAVADPNERPLQSGEAFVLQRLRDLFPTVLEPLRLRNDRNAPMFSLFFAMSNPSPAAAKVATPIAQHILAKARGQR